MSEENELWKPIDGFEGMYEVSSHGRVRSLNRSVKTVRGLWTYKGKILSQYVGNNGYSCTRIREKGFLALVHRLVADAFIPNPDNLNTVDHIDGDKQNNRASNLRWMSLSNNVKRFWKGVRRDVGPSFCMKLDESSVREARRLKPSHSFRALAVRFNVSKCTIMRAISGKTWAHVE